MKHHKFNRTVTAAICGWLACCAFPLGSSETLAGPSEPVTILLNNYVTGLTSEGGTEIGVLTSTGAFELAGIDTMVFRIEAETLHCEVAFADANGTFALSMQCRMIMTSETTGGGPGRWVITSGTGAYQNLHGTGNLTMDFDLGVFPHLATETLVGQVFLDERQ